MKFFREFILRQVHSCWAPECWGISSRYQVDLKISHGNIYYIVKKPWPSALRWRKNIVCAIMTGHVGDMKSHSIQIRRFQPIPKFIHRDYQPKESKYQHREKTFSNVPTFKYRLGSEILILNNQTDSWKLHTNFLEHLGEL